MTIISSFESLPQNPLFSIVPPAFQFFASQSSPCPNSNKSPCRLVYAYWSLALFLVACFLSARSSMHTCTGHGSSTCLLHKLAFGVRLDKYKNATHLKLNIAPEKLPSHKENSLLTIHFQGLYWTTTNQNNLHHFTKCLFSCHPVNNKTPKVNFYANASRNDFSVRTMSV